jgi:hypothetical protein
MIFFIKKNNETIIEIECWIEINKLHKQPKYIELISSININNYSNLLCSNIIKNKNDFINDISYLNNLRKWLWEETNHNYHNYDTIITILKDKLKNITNKYNLQFIID